MTDSLYLAISACNACQIGVVELAGFSVNGLACNSDQFPLAYSRWMMTFAAGTSSRINWREAFK